MPRHPTRPTPAPRHLAAAAGRMAWRRSAAGLVLMAAAGWAAAQTAPANPAPAPGPTPAAAATPANNTSGTPSDAVLHLLQERGLVPAAGKIESSPLVQQMRDSATEMVLTAMNFLGVRYVRGGNTAEQGFDCSGFTRYVFERSLGLVLPRRADEQAKNAGLLTVKQEELKPGDLVFFNTMRRAFSHVGIYVGEGKFIHAPRAGAEVRIEDMRQAYWAKRFNGARRAELPPPETPAPR